MDETQGVGVASKRARMGILIALAVVVALGAAYYFITRDAGPADPGPAATEIPKTPEQVQAEQQAQQEETLNTAREAIVSGNTDACASLPEGREQTTCQAYAVIAKAQAAVDVSLCAEITDEYWNTGCKDQILIYQAAVEQRPSLCDGLIVKARIPACKKQAGQ